MNDEFKSAGEKVRSALAAQLRRRFPPGEYAKFCHNLDAVGLRIMLWLIQECDIENPGQVMRVFPYIDRQLFEQNTQEWVEQELERIIEDSTR